MYSNGLRSTEMRDMTIDNLSAAEFWSIETISQSTYRNFLATSGTRKDLEALRYEMWICIQSGDIFWILELLSCGDWTFISTLSLEMSNMLISLDIVVLRIVQGTKVTLRRWERVSGSSRTNGDWCASRITYSGRSHTLLQIWLHFLSQLQIIALNKYAVQIILCITK